MRVIVVEQAAVIVKVLTEVVAVAAVVAEKVNTGIFNL